MNDIIKHRGPDDSGFVIFSSDQAGIDNINIKNEFESKQDYKQSTGLPLLALGHRRLSIVDLTQSGHQPMTDNQQKHWIVYNGEIYNHAELRFELQNLGYKFKSQCDTEVIINSYDAWGEACLNRFNGMWAFVLFDRRAKSIFVARDRFGIKPLYFWTTPDNEMAIASEIKQFTVLDGWNPVANNSTVISFLATGASDFDEQTMFKGVTQLKPGHYLKMPIGKGVDVEEYLQQQTKWYQIPNYQSEINLQDAEIMFRDLLIDAVGMRRQSEVQIGSCLSGGIDSSSIVCISHQIAQRQNAKVPIKTFSMITQNELLSEAKWIDAVTYKTNAQSLRVTPNAQDCLASLRSIVWHQDEPFGSLGIYGQNKVFELAASERIKVMLDGQGADEYLAGYDGFYSAYIKEIFSIKHLCGFLTELYNIKVSRGYSLAKITKLTLHALLPTKLSDQLKKTFGFRSAQPSWLNVSKFLKVDERSPLKFTTVRDLSIDLLCKTGIRALLHWEDRNSMAHSIEARVPFLDFRLVEFAIPLSSAIKIGGGLNKKVLRRAMGGILPKMIAERQDKLGFTTESDRWMLVDNFNEFRQILSESVRRSQGLISPLVIDHFDKLRHSKKEVPGHIWRIMCFGLWLDVFNVQLEEAL